MPSWCSGTWNSLKTFVNRNFYEPFGLRLEGGKIAFAGEYTALFLCRF